MTTCLGKSCSFGLPCASFVSNGLCVLIFLLSLRVGVGFDCISS